jgi:N-acetylglucosaminyldiphosphoundecaprenol N-acetyl-beta-D-mannosaminyltransferase
MTVHTPAFRTNVCDVPVDALTMTESLKVAEDLIAAGGPHQHVVVNAAKVVQARRDPNLMRIISDCEIINADGMAVVWAARFLGHPVPGRVAGIDFMLQLWRLAARNIYRVALLGATPEVVASAALSATRQGVQVVFAHDGYWSSDQEASVVDSVRAAHPDLLFLAIPSPRKEQFLSEHLDDLGASLVVGVGGSFDVVAGVTRRAPLWAQKAGLEWLFRLLQEPRRMFKRYMVGNSLFIADVIRVKWLNRERS